MSVPVLVETLRHLESAERSDVAPGYQVISLEFSGEYKELTILLQCGHMRKYSSVHPPELSDYQALLRTSQEAPPDGYPIPRSPSLSESWALLHYDISTTFDSLRHCEPSAQLRLIRRVSEAAAEVTLVGTDRRLVIETPLSGATLGGACVEFMMLWNTTSDDVSTARLGETG